jgi:hypothetical protein
MPVSIEINTISTRTSPGKPRSMPAWSRSVRFLSVLPRLFHGRTLTDVRSSSLRRVLSGINQCTIHRHPCSSIENILIRMAPVFTQSLRWLHGTSRFIYGTNQHGWFSSGTILGKNWTCLISYADCRMVPDAPLCLHALYALDEEAITTYFNVLGLTWPARAGLDFTTSRMLSESAATRLLQLIRQKFTIEHTHCLEQKPFKVILKGQGHSGYVLWQL